MLLLGLVHTLRNFTCYWYFYRYNIKIVLEYTELRYKWVNLQLSLNSWVWTSPFVAQQPMGWRSEYLCFFVAYEESFICESISTHNHGKMQNGGHCVHSLYCSPNIPYFEEWTAFCVNAVLKLFPDFLDLHLGYLSQGKRLNPLLLFLFLLLL